MLRVIDLQGRSYAVEGMTELTEQLSSDEKLSVRIPYTDINKDFIDAVGANWRFTGVKNHLDATQYVVKYISKRQKGTKPYIEATCILHPIEVLNTSRLYNFYEGEYSLADVLRTIFNNMPLTYRVVDTYDTNIKMESYGDGQTRLEIFSAAMELWGREFVVSGTHIDIYTHVARKPNYVLRDDINAKNIVIEEDANEMYTYVKAYGDINEGEALSTAGVAYVYEHPLSQVAMIGRKEAPPIKLLNNDDTSPYASVIRSQLEQMAKDLVDNSIKVSVTADFLALNDYPEAYPQIADEITFKATNINYETTIRIVGITTTRNHKGEISAQQVTFGEKRMADRYANNIKFAAQFITDLEAGRKKLSTGMLESAVAVATQLLLNARTELDFTSASGIWARNKFNNNEVVVFNSAGLGISDDGGTTFKNAITGAGIVADVITSGVLNTNEITIQGTTGVFVISGDSLTATDPNNPKKKVEITPGQIVIDGGGLQVNRPDGGVPTIIHGMMPIALGVWRYHPQFKSDEVDIDGAFFKTKADTNVVFDAFGLVHNRRYLIVRLEGRMYQNDTVSGAFVVEGFGGTSLFATQIVRGTSAGAYNFKIDIGPPTGELKYFYLKMRTANPNYPIYAREIIIAQED